MSFSLFCVAPIQSLTQILCRIESMKMETVIRSPQKGVIAKLVHNEGVRLLLSLTTRTVLTDFTGLM